MQTADLLLEVGTEEIPAGYIDGALAYERGNDDANPVTDFSIGPAASAGGAL